MMSGSHNKDWKPYLFGGLAGLVIVASVWLTGNYFGTSTTFARSAGMLESLVAAERVAVMPYFIKELPKIDWQWMFVAGIFIGAFIAAKIFGDFCWQAVPVMWEQHFGPSRLKRGLAAFVGGAVAMFGARLADG
jgi:glycerol uptake facilitator-like aquaporin